MNPTQRAYLELHFAVLLFGFTAILGDLISLTALVLVWWRMGITSFSITFLVNLKKQIQLLPRKLILKYLGIGVVVALHWICFFGSVKFANASIALICMAVTSFFTALLEPLVTKQRLNWRELSLGLLMIPGMILVVNNTEWSMMTGILIGLASAFLAALFAIFNKSLVNDAPALVITFLELSSGWLFLTLLLPIYFFYNPTGTFLPQGYDWLYLLILALGCTTLAYVLALRSLKYISAFASNLTINLEPVYGIIMAWFILNEHENLTTGFYIGCLLIVSAVFFHSARNLKSAKNESYST